MGSNDRAELSDRLQKPDQRVQKNSMATTSATNGISKTVRRFIVGAACALTVVLAPYIWQFAIQSGFKLSVDTSVWAQFGDYLAGTLGSAFGLLAFLGVLLTLHLQAMQLDLAKKQASLDEVQRLLATISTRLDQLLDQPVEHRFTLPSLRASPATFFHALSAGGGALLTTSSDWLRQALGATTAEEAKRALESPAGRVGIEIDQLAWCLGEYRKMGGAPEVVIFYKRRYGAIACWLDVLGFLSAHPHAHRELDPTGQRPSLSSILD